MNDVNVGQSSPGGAKPGPAPEGDPLHGDARDAVEGPVGHARLREPSDRGGDRCQVWCASSFAFGAQGW